MLAQALKLIVDSEAADVDGTSESDTRVEDAVLHAGSGARAPTANDAASALAKLVLVQYRSDRVKMHLVSVAMGHYASSSRVSAARSAWSYRSYSAPVFRFRLNRASNCVGSVKQNRRSLTQNIWGWFMNATFALRSQCCASPKVQHVRRLMIPISMALNKFAMT